MKTVLPRRLCLCAVMFAGLALVAVLTVVRRSDPPSAQTSTASGAPESLDPSALPEIRAELVASTQVPWNPQRDWEPGADVVISEEGELFVSQEQDWRILVIDEAGDIVRTIGRRGEGPGEFEQLSAIWFLGDTLVASDRAGLRLSYFQTDGRFLHSRRWVASIEPATLESAGLRMSYHGASQPSLTMANGLAVVIPRMSMSSLGNNPGTGAKSGAFSIPLLTVDEDGRIVDTLARNETTWTMFGMARGGHVFRVPVPFLRVTHTAVMPSGGGVVVVREDDSADPALLVTRIGPSADTVFSRRHSYAPTRLTDGLLRRALREAVVIAPGGAPAAEAGFTPAGAEFEGALRRSGVLPANLPAVSGLAVGQDESIWLRGELQEGESMHWTVLDGMGWVLGVVTLPRRQQLVAARGTVMVTVEEDELGRGTLMRYRLGHPVG